MSRKILRQFLQILYPALVFAGVFLAWSSSNQAELARFSSPPVDDGFAYWWQPGPRVSISCGSFDKKKLRHDQDCVNFKK